MGNEVSPIDPIKALLEEQKKLLQAIESQGKRLDQIEQRLKKIESEKQPTMIPELTPALVRVLKSLAEAGKPVGGAELARSLSLSRNLTSGYLGVLQRMGLVVKRPNMERLGDARYLFQLNQEALEALPEHIKKIIFKSKPKPRG